jgi:UDP-2,3-diacylglucosamine hydrolase
VRDLVFVADIHLVEGDDLAPAFADFLRSLVGNTRECIIVGDLFNVWIARRRFMSPGQLQLLQVMDEVAAAGVRFKYVEGNRDYFVGENWGGGPFAEVATNHLRAASGPTRLLVSHGDLVNEADRQYRAWRAFSRSAPVRGLLALLPSSWGQRLANDLERRLRGTNLKHKAALPMQQLERFTRKAASEGYQGVVLGHFHTQVERPVDGATLWILPDWRDGRRYLRFSEDGSGRFLAFGA